VPAKSYPIMAMVQAVRSGKVGANYAGMSCLDPQIEFKKLLDLLKSAVFLPPTVRPPGFHYLVRPGFLH
jgi:hypothetical protein